MNQVDFGKKLRELRDAKGENQGQLGTILNVGEKQIQRYEGGEVLPTHENLVKLCEHYKYDFISLLYGIGKTNNSEVAYYNKYVALLEKSELKSEKIIETQEADLQALRVAVNKITLVDQKIDKLELTVNGLSGKVEVAESNIEVLREWLIDQFVKLKKESPQSVAASMGRKAEELYQKAQQRDTRIG